MPAWQLAMQTSLCAAPSVTPHPKVETKLPLASNFCTRALPLPANICTHALHQTRTYTLPLAGETAIPTAAWNWPLAEPWLPNDDRGTRTACARAAPRRKVEAQIASATLAMSAGPTRSWHRLL